MNEENIQLFIIHILYLILLIFNFILIIYGNKLYTF